MVFFAYVYDIMIRTEGQIFYQKNLGRSRILILQNAKVGIPYTIVSIDLPDESVRHLSDLGLKVGASLKLVSKTPFLFQS